MTDLQEVANYESNAELLARPATSGCLEPVQSQRSPSKGDYAFEYVHRAESPKPSGRRKQIKTGSL